MSPHAKCFFGCAALCAASLAATAARAGTFTSLSDPLDREYLSNNSTSNGVSNDLRAGTRVASADPAAQSIASPVFFFALPALPAGEVVDTAFLSLELNTAASTQTPVADANVDLYGLPFQAAPLATPAANDPIILQRYYQGPNDTRYPKLQEDFFVPADVPAVDPTNRKTSVNIGSFIQGLYTAGAQPGDFAVLRLSYDDATFDATVNNSYRFRSGDAAVALGDRPVLTINTITGVPEINAMGMVLGALVMTGVIGLVRRGETGLGGA